MAQYDGLGVFRLNPGVQVRRPVGPDDLYQRSLMAHAHAADAFDRCARARFRHGFGQGLLDVPAAPGNAAGAQADADLAFGTALRRPGPGRSLPPGGAPFLPFQEVLDDPVRLVGLDVPVGDLVDLHNRGERAAAQAGDLLEREQLAGVGVFFIGDVQKASEGVAHERGALDVAGRAVADANQMPAHRPPAELVVEARYSVDLGGRDLRDLPDAMQDLFGQVSVVFLNGL